MEMNSISIKEALPIAEKHIADVVCGSERLKAYQFGPVYLRWETERYWVFSSASEQLIEEGYVPGAISACVDKADGHIWSIEEQSRYAQSFSPIQQVTQPESAVA
jgi:hypothetical protein